jgi:hypothetical protein
LKAEVVEKARQVATCRTLCANFAFEFKNELLKKIEIKIPFQLKYK